MKETKIQGEYVIDFLTRSEEKGGLGYRQVAANVVSDLFIPSIYSEFLKNAEPDVWSRLLRQFSGNEKNLLDALQNAIKELSLKYQNVAIMFNKNKTFTFMQETLPLFYVSGAELRGDEDFKKNIFAVVEESSHTIRYAGDKLYTVRPDITFYLNGIYIGYLEFKSLTMGQNAKVKGREKIAKDYLSTIAAYCQKEKENPSIFSEKKNICAIYEKGLHLVTSDLNETYVVRGIGSYFDAAHAAFAEEIPATVDSLIPEVVSIIKPYPVSKDSLPELERFEEVMNALYSKKMIEKEILYYNFIEYKYIMENGKARRTSNTGRLIAPRPKQKFGCDKIMNRIFEMLENEDDPDYYNNKLRQQLQTLDIPAQVIEEILLERNRFHNNKFVYSLLLQYAAGFGKSNIIGWTALQLKDYRYNGEYAYDKIMIVVDRIELRGQLDIMMMNMNIDKTLFVEAVDQDTFISALDDIKHRIIVVNIQKFLDLQYAIDKAKKKLRNMRVAFLIDEIHRSNSGENNKEMINLFERIQDSFNTQGEPVNKRKNLLIGFTATPDPKTTLPRFGEFIKAAVIPTWVPFDTYSMKEAIEEGYILDPTEHIITYKVPVKFEKPEGLEEGDIDPNSVKFVKENVYSFEPRMRKIAEFIVDRLVTLVYGKIKGEGKAMLAVSSIGNAIKYCNIIRQLYAKKCEEKLYAKYKDAPISIVYSDNQNHQPSSMLNNGLSEKDVIQNFKNAKNGLIIVVDKLQTGFDEPKLHTLFLDKEITGINAIQTISRVNRTCKYKKECHVIDCSWKNVNKAGITQAFKDFCDMVISHFNPEEEAKNIANMYKQLVAHELYKKWYKGFETKHDDTTFTLLMEDGIRQWIKQCFAQEEAAIKYNEEHGLKEVDPDYQAVYNRARDLKLLIGQYGSSVMDLKNIYELSEKYTDELFLKFWNVYCKIYQNLIITEHPKTASIVVVDSDELPGITMVEDGSTPPQGPTTGPRGHHTRPKKGKEKTVEDVLTLLKKLNDEEQLSAQLAQVWLTEIGKMYDELAKDNDLTVYLKDNQFAQEDKLKKYKIAQSRYYRQNLKGREDINTELFKKLLDDNAEQLFATFLAGLQDASDQQPDFDTDTNAGGNTTATNWDELMRLAKEKIIEKWRPTYNEQAIKNIIIRNHEDNFTDITNMYAPFTKVVDFMFKVINTPLSEKLDGINETVPDALNILLRAEELPDIERNKNMNQILLGFEGFLKKLFKMATGRDVYGTTFADPTLSNCLRAVKTLHELEDEDSAVFHLPEYQRLKTELSLLQTYRNKLAAHPGMVFSPENVKMMIPVVIDMYLYATGTYARGLIRYGYDA